ncbi:hypothetical protein ACFOW1_12775 [Parasediminibacterium paludis]|uniref:FimV-like protein n=1 Tax=Parasediminibacterium paludis TaxID=908966 RepID=A0ABV8PXS3_9BACT
MAIEQVLYNLSGNNHLSSVGIDDLQKIANEFPYFAPAQFLLALKQKEQSSYSFNGQLQKAALHFSNPLWLQYQLHNGTIAEPILEKVVLNGHPKQPVVVQPTVQAVVEKPILQPTTYASIPVVENATALPDLEPKVQEVTPLVEATEKEIPTIPEIGTDETDVKTVGKEAIDELPVASFASHVAEEVHQSGVVDYTSFALSNSLRDTAPLVKTEAPVSIETPHTPSTDKILTNSFDNNANSFSIPTLEAVKRLLDVNAPATTSTEPPTQVEAPKTNIATIPNYSFNGFADTTKEITPNAVTLSEAFAEEEVDGVDEHDKHPTNNIASVLSNQIADFKKPITEDAKLEFEAEPLFKVDYFASQGIKIDLTKQPQDKLTVQLRRFTDWLRQIKGQGPNPPQDLGTDPELEKAIANIAKTSIAAREIVTETMADVFIKQGKVDKAIQLYIKLSFLDPEKSAYFAGKIQQLKGI